MDREKVKEFWAERAKNEAVCPESQVILENDAQLAELRARTEFELLDNELPLNKSQIVVDIGAGNGRFTMYFAPKAKKVVSVEYIKDFADSIKKQAERSQTNNIEVLNMSAEEFRRENYADVIYVSGVLHYLDKEQYRKVISNISKTLKPGGTFFLCESISVLKDEYFIDKFSDELNVNYCSLYRTGRQHIDAFSDQGFLLKKFSPVFEDGSVLNRRVETRFHYFIFKNIKDQ
jgi:cyclopropane fatty-acyl-phospholipid synthase-like methyltransferase